MVIIDTTVWVDYLRGKRNPRTEWIDQELTRQRLGLTDLILCEVLQGITDRSTFVQTRDQLLRFQIFDTGGKDLAIESAVNYTQLRRRGYTIRKTIDCIIATFCLQSKHQLLHSDRDYDPFETVLGLKVVHPLTSTAGYPIRPPRP